MSREISPLDGRYAQKLAALGAYFSEYALMRARVRVELEFLLAQEETGLWAPLSDAERGRIAEVMDGFSDDDYAAIKAIEAVTHHDVKACELFLRDKLALTDPNRIHFGLTSADVNNLAFSTMLSTYKDEQQLPTLARLMRTLRDMAERWRDAPMPSRTHGQKASPTTAGKEVAVFVARLQRQAERLRDLRLRGKLNGATGNYSAFVSAFPDYDWIGFSQRLVRRLGMEPNIVTTQIEDHDTWGEYLDITRRVANILIDLDRDFWLYLSMGFFADPADADQVGSSTMPHKVNPIRFENSEGNAELALGLLGALSDKLSRARLQRDLSDSTATRNLGVALAHVHLSLQETHAGLGKLVFDAERCLQELDASPELLAEPIQTILRTAGVDDPYDLLKRHTRGQAVTHEHLMALVGGLDVAEPVKVRLRGLRVRDYVGLAARICDQVVAQADAFFGTVEERP